MPTYLPNIVRKQRSPERSPPVLDRIESDFQFLLVGGWIYFLQATSFWYRFDRLLLLYYIITYFFQHYYHRYICMVYILLHYYYLPPVICTREPFSYSQELREERKVLKPHLVLFCCGAVEFYLLFFGCLGL